MPKCQISKGIGQYKKPYNERFVALLSNRVASMPILGKRKGYLFQLIG